MQLQPIGAVLSQTQKGDEKVIAYGSKSLNSAQKNYCVPDRELLAVRYFVEYYRSYLLGRKFLVRTDHQAIKWLCNLKQPRSRIARWVECLAEYHFEVEHRPGHKHGNADSMSRCPNPWDCQCKDLEVLRCGPCKKCMRKTELMEGTLPGKFHKENVQRIQASKYPCSKEVSTYQFLLILGGTLMRPADYMVCMILSAILLITYWRDNLFGSWKEAWNWVREANSQTPETMTTKQRARQKKLKKKKMMGELDLKIQNGQSG
jgi:hypothetical protein